MTRIDSFIRFITGLRFLPECVRRWLFGTGTRLFETLNLALMASFAVYITYDRGAMFTTESYAGFYRVFGPLADEAIAAIFAIGAVLAAMGLFGCGWRSKRFGGFALLIGAVMWLLFAAGFWFGDLARSTAQVIYPVLSMFCYLAGEHKMHEAEQGLARASEARHA